MGKDTCVRELWDDRDRLTRRIFELSGKSEADKDALLREDLDGLFAGSWNQWVQRPVMVQAFEVRFRTWLDWRLRYRTPQQLRQARRQLLSCYDDLELYVCRRQIVADQVRMLRVELASYIDEHLPMSRADLANAQARCSRCLHDTSKRMSPALVADLVKDERAMDEARRALERAQQSHTKAVQRSAEIEKELERCERSPWTSADDLRHLWNLLRAIFRNNPDAMRRRIVKKSERGKTVSHLGPKCQVLPFSPRRTSASQPDTVRESTPAGART